MSKPTVLEHPTVDNSDIVERLGELLEQAKAGEITDFACLYLVNSNPYFCFAQSFRHLNRCKIIVGLDLMKQNIQKEYDVDPDEAC